MYPEDPTTPEAQFNGSGSFPVGQADASNGGLLTEAQFQRRSQLVAQALLNEIADNQGRIKANADPVRAERALSSARQVIESIRKARDSLHKEHEDQQFESAVIAAAQQLPKECQTKFLSVLEKTLSSATTYRQ